MVATKPPRPGPGGQRRRARKPLPGTGDISATSAKPSPAPPRGGQPPLEPGRRRGQVGVDRTGGDGVERLRQGRGASAAAVTPSTRSAPTAAPGSSWRTTPAGVATSAGS